ncbi:TonB-dependent receptor [Bacteroides sp. OttesenSCG-928-E20]|nr:TonB-dependent receptor [Bacteroides sp. OttesenSCG-928-N06]MDL2299559.1 TonB-dependent receptor [Bacteroides sp. OttesenSCG-928-E20]MDL2304740.1 TonB-dependent receptor [Bacteroides sp. OttesenSCG-928-D19]
MKENTLTKGRAFRWKQFSHKAYAVFFSLKREVNIGVLSVSTVVCASVATATAQTPDTPQQMKNYELAEIEVTGTRVPLTELESAKMVTVLSRADIQAAAVHSINDLLKYAAGVDVRQRGEFGVQTDISVRGGTFDQVTILLNGVNITDSQTGHHSAAFPVSMNDIERIEVLEGPAARVFGTSAFTGAINIVTRKEQHNSSLQANLMGGDYGLFGGGARVNYAKGPLANTVSASYNRSDGATNNSDFRIGRAYYQGLYTSGQVDVQWQLGFSDQAFGANTFYSAAYPNQYEELRRYMASVRAETKGALRFSPTVYWNRKYDNFQLVRGDDFGQNFHLNDVHGINLNAHFNTGLGKTAFGAEFRNEGIRSSNLGKPYQEQGRYTKKDNRTNISYYLEHTVLLRQWTISVGAMANMNTALDHKYRLYPGVDISYRPARNWKLFASWNMALRMPTFTDLYYKSPTIEGNIGLKPEETRAISAGARYRTPVVDASLSAFFNKGKNMIDWVMYHQEDTYHSANFKLDNMGLEATAGIDFRQLMSPATFLGRLHISYAYIHQKRHDDTQVYKSNYALEYLRHKLVARLDHRIWKELHANWAFRWQDRMGSYLKEGGQVPYSSFGLLDLKLVWQGKSYQLFAEANNVFDCRYYDFGSVPQPGVWVRAGINISCPLQFFRR